MIIYEGNNSPNDNSLHLAELTWLTINRVHGIFLHHRREGYSSHSFGAYLNVIKVVIIKLEGEALLRLEASSDLCVAPIRRISLC